MAPCDNPERVAPPGEAESDRALEAFYTKQRREEFYADLGDDDDKSNDSLMADPNVHDHVGSVGGVGGVE